MLYQNYCIYGLNIYFITNIKVNGILSWLRIHFESLTDINVAFQLEHLDGTI